MAQKTWTNRETETEAFEDDLWVRPREPWGDWRRDTGSLQVDESRDSVGHYGDEDQLLNSIPVSPEFDAFLMELQNKHMDGHTENFNRKILNDVPTMIVSTFKRLETIYPDTFLGAVVHTVGSVGEQTKVGLYEEFDFMVELHALEQVLLRLARPLKSKSELNTVYLSEGFHLVLDDDPNSEEVIEIPFKSTSIDGVIAKELLASLLPGWKVTSHMRRSHGQKSFVLQQSLRHYPANGDPLEVFCDISFCVPFQWAEDKRHIYRRSGTREDMMSRDQNFHLVINWDFCPVTHVFHQNDKLAKNDMPENVKCVYRLAKILTLDLLPPIYDMKRDKFGGPLQSYWLKQIITYMVDELPNPSFWQEEYLDLRVIQLMRKLRNCVKDMTLSDYFWPDLNHLDDSPKSKRAERETAHDYVPALVALLNRAAGGENSALASLKTLSEMTAEFRSTVITDAKMIRFDTMIRQYDKVLKSRPWEEVPFMVNLYSSSNILTNIKEFVVLHLKDVVEVSGEEGNVKIRYKSEELSLEDYFAKYISDSTMHARFFFGFFTTDWNDAYDKMMAERCPDLAKQLGTSQPQAV
ncbi:uncharacterized protein LOC135479058 [Liolophura sinensis]|uniref:uncharacterized protein LOC135479058 n=1 Tax=Liolophura sinensis TaxID=3198878 RepID=UPI00315971DA